MFLAIVTVAMIAAGDNTPAYSQQEKTNDDDDIIPVHHYEKFYDETNDYTIEYPASWNAISDIPGVIIFMSQSGTNANVLVSPIGNNNNDNDVLDFDEFIDQSTTEMKLLGFSITKVDDKEQTFGGQKSTLIESSNGIFEYYQVVTIRNDNDNNNDNSNAMVYVLSFATLSENAEEEKKIFKHMAESFAFGNIEEEEDSPKIPKFVKSLCKAVGGRKDSR